MKIGVLALQGSFEEHRKRLEELKIEVILIRDEMQVKECDGIILPGGESTSMSILEDNIFTEIKKLMLKGLPVWGTCAGLILLSNNINGKIKGQKNIGGLSITIERNFYGSQLQSFIRLLDYPREFGKDGKFDAVFIRAPVICSVNGNAKILLKCDENIVAVREGNILGTSFHPELTKDIEWHNYFINLVLRNIREKVL